MITFGFDIHFGSSFVFHILHYKKKTVHFYHPLQFVHCKSRQENTLYMLSTCRFCLPLAIDSFTWTTKFIHSTQSSTMNCIEQVAHTIKMDKFSSSAMKKWTHIFDCQLEIKRSNLTNNLLKCKTLRKLPSSLENIPQIKKETTEGSRHGTGWTWKHKDIDWLCPKISPDKWQREVGVVDLPKERSIIYDRLAFRS